VISGAESAFRILATRWYFRPALWLYLVPGIRHGVDAMYRLIARNRHRLGGGSTTTCDTGACGLRRER
jgi:predicted DCC family thiol-disulfide oxidoreductase YuxK